jgi:capsular polysaccharide biosynthesis protein
MDFGKLLPRRKVLPNPPAALVVKDVALSSCFMHEGQSVWNSGFLRKQDHLTFGLRRVNGLFGLHCSPFPELPLGQELESAYFGGVLFPYYGHFVFESISCLPNIPDDGRPILFMCLNSTVTAWHKEFFKDAGLANRVVFTKKSAVTQVGELIHVDQSTVLLTHLSAKYIDFTARIFPTRAPTGRMIYLSRRGCKNAPVLNEEAFESRLKQLGFEIVQPESMPIREQVRVANEAQVIVAVEGSALHTLVFSSTPKQVFILARRKKIDFNFVLQFAMQPHLQIEEIYCMKKYGADFKDTSELDIDLAVGLIESKLGSR